MIEHAREGNVHVVTLGDDANLINPAFVARLHEALDAVDAASNGPSGLILTGRGKFFSNGLDVPTLMKLEPEAMKQFNRDLVRAFGRLVTAPIPTAAAVNGHAFAGGAVLALTCDWRVMRADRGWICMSEVDAGVPIGTGPMAMLRAKLPAATVRDAVLKGQRYAADDAIAAGWADAKAPKDGLVAAALDIVRPLAEKDRGIYRSLKRTLWADLGRAFGLDL